MKNTFTLFYPIDNYKAITQYFGQNPEYYKANYDVIAHNGMDFWAAHGTPVYAAHDGIAYPGVDDNGGNGVVIRTDKAYAYGGGEAHFKSIYWHLVKANAVVKYGQKVKAGDLIGYADNTGKSTGNHLHFGLKACAWNESEWTWYNVDQNNGYNGAIDPQPYFNGFKATEAQKIFGMYNGFISLLSKMLNYLQR